MPYHHVLNTHTLCCDEQLVCTPLHFIMHSGCIVHWRVCACVQVQVYVNGQLAGFSPIYYTMYTVRERVELQLWLPMHSTQHSKSYQRGWVGMRL